MTGELLLSNLWAWFVQAGVLITVGIVAARLFRWRHPHSRLRFFQLLLLAAVLLPFVAPRRPLPPLVLFDASATPRQEVAELAAVIATPVEWESLVIWLLALGVAARLLWLAFGIARLGGLRKLGRAIPVEGVTGIEIREVPGLRGPAAFGWLRPVILLPSGLPDGPVREAALLHELQHVLRRDWLENMAERVLATALWFHPAVWWLLERIHLTREQAVDTDVAGAAGIERDRYLQALLASAGLANRPALPVVGFIRRPRHLVERVAFLTQEATMSIRGTAVSAAFAALISGAAIALATYYLPMQLPAQTVALDPKTHWQRFSRKGTGTVLVEVTVNAEGEAVEARVLSGPDELRKEALQAVLNQLYPADAASRRNLQITIEFENQPRSARGGLFGGVTAAGAPAPPPPPPPPPLDQAAFAGVDYIGLSPDLQQRAAGVMSGLQSGQKVTEADLARLRGNLSALDPALTLGTSISGTAGEETRLRLRVSNEPPVPQRIRVGGMVQAANLINKVDPVYPPLAREARIQGMVRFEVKINGQGEVEGLTLVSGHPLLVQAAQQAVSQWKYRPVLLNGNPVHVATVVDVNFTLSN